ncbi:uncharacterized protein BDV14DRAFT_177528 [Aspergillus stella-maris]|uniref:uncharacterized protein n=1 Tax=Aspergillus stella-maris TaxID=1810926 RepID=UPI003CCDA397
MRFFIPLALLGATVMAADQTPTELLNSVIPSCMAPCFTTALENVSGCSDLDDKDCVCKADTLDTDNISGITDDLTKCASNCSSSELEELANLDVSSLNSKVEAFCGAAPILSASSAVIAAGAMVFYAFL